jgi:HCNGP-like protein
MSGLVGYGSSSDEDEGEDIHAQAKIAANDSAEMTDITARVPARTRSNAPTNAMIDAPAVGPLLEPAAPVNEDSIEGDTTPETPETMSERDTVRYLTRPPIPMTSMPASPPGSPDPVANARFARFLELKAKGLHFNEDLARKSNFLNPALLSTMMTRAGIDEEDQYNTTLSLDLWNPKGFPSWAYEEELLKSQQEIREKENAEKKALSAAGKRTIEFAPSSENSRDSSRTSSPGYQKKRRRP